MKTTLSKRLGLAFAAALGAIGVSLLVPSIAMTAMPNPLPPGINLGGLHLTPTSGSGTDTPSFVADSACPAGTNLANVNTIDLLHVEQTISLNVPGPQSRVPGFGTDFNVDMAAVHALAGTPGTAESFLFMIDCRTGAAHGTYLDAVQVDFHADGTWQVHDSNTPTTPTPSVSTSRSASASPSASHSASHSASASASGTGARRVVVGSAVDAHLERPARG